MGSPLLAHYGAPPPFPLQRTARMSDDRLLFCGEPFLVHADHRLNKIPLIRLFGPGRYWRVTTDRMSIVGEGHDGANHEQFLMILEMRRKCEVYGKWFSRYCADGECGTRLFGELEIISEETYLDTIIKLKERG